jgi:hypothetical protein
LSSIGFLDSTGSVLSSPETPQPSTNDIRGWRRRPSKAVHGCGPKRTRRSEGREKSKARTSHHSADIPRRANLAVHHAKTRNEHSRWREIAGFLVLLGNGPNKAIKSPK